MTVSVTMLQTRLGEDGTLWTAGTTHDATDDFARLLITYNYATGTLPYPLQSLPLMHLTATAAEIAAMSGQPGVFYEERDGNQRLFRWFDGAMHEVGTGVAGGAAVQQSDPVTATGLAYTGPGYYAGLNVTAYNGGPQTVTVRDSLDATGDVLAVVTVTGIGTYGSADGALIAMDVGLHLTISGGTSRTVSALLEGF